MSDTIGSDFGKVELPRQFFGFYVGCVNTGQPTSHFFLSVGRFDVEGGGATIPVVAFC